MKAQRSFSRAIFSKVFLCLATLVTATVAGAASDTPIVMGMSAPFSGPNGQYGKQMREGIEACFARVNDSGGVHGRQLRLVARDDGYEVERAVANARDLIKQDKAYALMGFYGSAATEAVLPVLDANSISLIGTISGAEALRDPPNPHMFHLRASYNDETAAIIKSLLTVGLKRVAVLYQDDAFGQAGLKGVKAALAQSQLDVVAAGTVPRNSTQIKQALATITAAKPQAVVLATLAMTSAEFIKEAKAQGLPAYFVALSPVGTDQLISLLGKDTSRGIQVSQVIPYPLSDRLKVVREYRQALIRYSKDAEPSYYGLEGYINARLVVAALERADAGMSRESLVKALRSGPFDLGGYQVNFPNGSNSGSHYVEISVIGADGRIMN